MSYFSSRLSPTYTPRPLKIVILLTIGLCLFCALCDAMFPYFFGIPGPQMWFSLSLWGLKRYFIWQVLTYFFVAPVAGGLSLSLIFYILFNMYFIWVVGSSVIDRRGPKHFLGLYLGGGITGGVVASIVILTTHTMMPLAGANAALYALLTAWMMLLPEVEILLFFAIPVKVKWLIVGILGVHLLVDISHGNFLTFFLYLSSIGFGYTYALTIWGIHSPFRRLHRFERVVLRLGNQLKRKFSQPTTYEASFSSSSKIYDFKTGRAILTDEEFMDACLSKIATKGKKSLTIIERIRLRKISKRKRKSQ
ncbi:MAG: hypothetical protein S4CHLAM37_07240 [Chlamydiia bacterium]|nr:hypothetical protein [Chlamydiia bacterium]